MKCKFYDNATDANSVGRSTERVALHMSETNRVPLVLFGMQNKTTGPYLAAIDRILISLVAGSTE
jgi:hypothetical protein